MVTFLASRMRRLTPCAGETGLANGRRPTRTSPGTPASPIDKDPQRTSKYPLALVER